jgi:alpha-mannosidase
MHDEAGTHYIDMIDQTTLGHQYIVKEFGEHANPTIGWQVDPFGHSATQAALLSAEVGFDALFFGRIDYQDHAWRVAAHEMQFNWAPSPSLGPTASVWSEVALDGNYNPPDTFCWDTLCGGNNPQVQDRSDLEDRNVERRVAEFIEAARAMAATRKGDIETTNVMWNMGRSVLIAYSLICVPCQLSPVL